MKKKLKSPKKLKNKSVLLGVTGGVAAYKAVDLVRMLKKEEASVTVIMTEASASFVTPLSLQLASQNPVYTTLYDDPLAHIRLSADADLMLVAPATANIIGKFSHGIADDLLSTAFLAFRKPVVLAPSMNWRMYEHPAVQENLAILTSRGVRMVGPEEGELACGEEGKGRLAGLDAILAALRDAVRLRDLEGRRVLVTAGPTREYIDPVRFISNRSSGKMGYAVAEAARDRGADVTLISGPSALSRPPGIRLVSVDTADGMLKAVRTATREHPDLLVMAAAVADYRPAERRTDKIDKKDERSLRLEATEDIIEAVAQRQTKTFIVGFAAETGNKPGRAEQKRRRKGMDMIVFNDVLEPGAGFDGDTNRVIIMDRLKKTDSGLRTKREIADMILDRYCEITA